MFSFRKIGVMTATASVMLTTLMGTSSLAEVSPSTISPAALEDSPDESITPMMPSGEMQQRQQMMMRQMGQMHELMGQMQQRMANMTPEQMQEFRPKMMAHHQAMIEQMQQLLDEMPQTLEQEASRPSTTDNAGM